jgi:hypothetical protein
VGLGNDYGWSEVEMLSKDGKKGEIFGICD